MREKLSDFTCVGDERTTAGTLNLEVSGRAFRFELQHENRAALVFLAQQLDQFQWSLLAWLHQFSNSFK